MRFDLITIFPEFFAGPLDFGIVGRARQRGLVETPIHDLRLFTEDRHRTIDDRPFGGGEGMVLKPAPIFDAVESLVGSVSGNARGDTAILLLSASGRLFDQATARRLAELERIVLICGRYEGVDERVALHLATDELSIGDFVLSGGELAAAVVVDAVTRLVPGTLGNEDSRINESFSAPEGAVATPPAGASHRRGTGQAGALLDYPHYTRPQSFRGWDVPEILLSGNHQQIRQWRREQALAKTVRNRPDLLA